MELKFKTTIEQGWMQVEQAKIKAKSGETVLNNLTKREDTHVRAVTQRDVAEIQAGAQLLNTHAEAAHESVARRETLAAAERAASKPE
jgi:hypothetical protein